MIIAAAVNRAAIHAAIHAKGTTDMMTTAANGNAGDKGAVLIAASLLIRICYCNVKKIVLQYSLYKKQRRELIMGIFGGGYTKPGKGVDKNAPKKKGFFLFFDIIIHKFTKFLGANCLYTMTSILWIAALYFFAGIVLSNTNIVNNIAASINAVESGIDPNEMYGSIMLMLQLMFAAGVFIMWGSGPASAAYSYINRCFTRGEHAWIISDGLDKFKENFKQGMLVVIIDAVVLVFGINAAHFYWTFYISTHSFIWMLLTYIMALVFIIYTMMHPYIYQIMVTFECKIGAIYKNAFLLTLGKLPLNLLLTAVSAAVLAAVFIFFNPLIASLVLVIFGLCFTRYTGEFYAARVIERSILRDIKEKKPVVEYIGEDDAE